LDFECPKSSPNYFDRCAAFDQFIAWNKNLPRDQATVLKEDPPTALQMMERVNAVLNRPKRLNLENKTTSTSPKQNKVDDTDYYENDDDATTTTENPGLLCFIFLL
jgi:hypothetical protein